MRAWVLVGGAALLGVAFVVRAPDPRPERHRGAPCSATAASSLAAILRRRRLRGWPPSYGRRTRRRAWLVARRRHRLVGRRPGGVDLLRGRPRPRGAVPLAGRRRLPALPGRRGASGWSSGSAARATSSRPAAATCSTARSSRGRCWSVVGDQRSARWSAERRDGWLPLTLSLAYPVGDLVLATLVLLALARGAARRAATLVVLAARARRPGGRGQRLRLPGQPRSSTPRPTWSAAAG